MTMPRHDWGSFRDKVVALDPSTVSPCADSEAGGAPMPDAAEAELAHAAVARRAVPRIDLGRAAAAGTSPEVVLEHRRRNAMTWSVTVVSAIAAAVVVLSAW